MTPGNSNKRSRPVTLKDIANHCGVGKSIVSYALRNVPCVRRETRERILAAAVELGYDPAAQESARRLVAQRHPRKLLNHLIALILPNDFYRVTYFGSMFRGVMEVLLPAGYDVLIMHPMGQDAHAVIGSPSIRRGDVDGVIAFHPSDLDEHDLASLRNHVNFRNRPIISLINPLPTCTSVLTDDEAGAYAATQHLLAQGHRHLLTFVTWVEASAARLRGVTSALRDAGLDPARHLQRAMPQDVWLKYEDPTQPRTLVFNDLHCCSLEQFIHDHPEVSGIMAWNDACAHHVWYQLEQCGLRVPDDISLIGFDDTEPIADHDGKNLLTSVRLPLCEVGRQAAQLMLDQLTQEDPKPEELLLPTELVIRHSTAPHTHAT